jgi:hypothetical protein
MEEMEERLLQVLSRHRGRENCIGMGELFAEVFGRPCVHRINDTDALRRLVRRLRRRGEPICSRNDHDNPGYYLAESAAELQEFAERHRRRGLASLAQAAAVLKVSLADYLGQLRLEEERGQGPGARD